MNSMNGYGELYVIRIFIAHPQPSNLVSNSAFSQPIDAVREYVSKGDPMARPYRALFSRIRICMRHNPPCERLW